GVTTARRLLALSFAGARHTLWIANSYFVPDAGMRRQLLAAARRGVDVRLLLPGPVTDVPITRHAARSDYELLLRGGIRIFEYQPQMMHAKTFVIDGAFAMIGSLNLDARSLYFNDEAALLVHDTAFGARMDSVFVADLRHAREIRLAEFLRRPWHQRARELFADLVSRFL
ncbi:MAG: phospholipase D-like domain-containing protein, partial [Longimicrobiales bacterium]